MVTRPEFDDKKFSELVLYVAERMGDDAAFGATKLNKVLFFSDFLAYQSFGRSITGATYQKLPHGPAPRQLLPIQRELVEAEAARLIHREYLGRTQKRLVALRDAHTGVFQGDELDLVNQIIEALRGSSAVNVSNLSHSLSVGWRVASIGDDIPYESVFLSTDPATEDDVRRGRELAEQHGWLAAAS